jgi:hypothetical protein
MRMGVLHKVVVHCMRHIQSAIFFSNCEHGAFRSPVGRPPAASVCMHAGPAATKPRSVHRVKKMKRRHTFSTAGLDDEDILSSHALLNLNTRLAALELVKQHLGRRYAEVVADSPARRLATAAAALFFHRRNILCELRVRAPAQNHNVAHHDDVCRSR